ncbi:MBL fold metallo-hydrolase [Anaerosolibacter carboniphilus]|nr:MBL fold metallo-hydrolase [Anaerosolibacter carboniphilus]
MVNLCFIGNPHDRFNKWVLVDAGMVDSMERILEASAERFGSASTPQAIILTHGHFDHVGAVKELAVHWDVPVYAHAFELPYLTGQSDYPPPDPSVGGGLMARISSIYPRKAIDLGNRVKPLPSDGTIPFMTDWRWIHTPGHTPGHVSLFRDQDGVLIAGDAFTTVKQESAWAVLTQEKEVHGPPAYFTTDWKEAWRSVEKLRALHPKIVITGHGQPMYGKNLSEQLDALAKDFDELAIPDHGRYVH